MSVDVRRRLLDCTCPATTGTTRTRSCSSGRPASTSSSSAATSSTASRGGNRVFTLQQSLALRGAAAPDRARPRTSRAASESCGTCSPPREDEVRRPNMPGLLKDVEAVIIDGDLDCGQQAQQQPGAGRAAQGRVPRRTPRPRPRPCSGSRTTRSCVARSAPSSSTRRRFQQRADAFETAFSDPAQWLNLTGALLATGDYQRRRPNTQAWQFGTASPANEAVWRYLLTEATREDLAGTRDGPRASSSTASPAAARDLQTHLTDVMTAWLAEREQRTYFDWRYYLVKYPAMRGARDERRKARRVSTTASTASSATPSACCAPTAQRLLPRPHPAAGVALLRREGRRA